MEFPNPKIVSKASHPPKLNSEATNFALHVLVTVADERIKKVNASSQN